MKFLDKILKGVNPDEDPLDNDIFEDDELYGSGDNSFGNTGDISDFMSNGGGYSSPYSNPSQQGAAPQTPPQNQQNNNYQPAPQPVNTGGMSVGGGNMQLSVELKVVKPEDYQNVNQIADHLINRKTVILNLEETNKETARRLIDFLAGVAYAIQGQLERVSDRTFVITPSNIVISPEQIKDDQRRSSRTDTSIY